MLQGRKYRGEREKVASYNVVTYINQFSDTRTALDDLPDAMKAKLKDKVALHSLWHSRKLAAPEYFKNEDPLEHPMIKRPLLQVHEASGREVGIPHTINLPANSSRICTWRLISIILKIWIQLRVIKC